MSHYIQPHFTIFYNIVLLHPRFLISFSPNFVVVSPERLYRPLELVRNIQLVCVKEEQDSVHSLCKPLEDADKVVAAVGALLLARQNAGGVHDGNA
jgi:hypothetical protein